MRHNRKASQRTRSEAERSRRLGGNVENNAGNADGADAPGGLLGVAGPRRRRDDCNGQETIDARKQAYNHGLPRMVTPYRAPLVSK